MRGARDDEINLRACIAQDGSCIPIVTYGDGPSCNHIARGRNERANPANAVSAIPQKVALPANFDPSIFRDEFRMYQQIGGTCSLACTSAILSDISMKHGGAAIDPYVVSDLIAAISSEYSNGLDKPIDDIDKLNIQPGDLAYLNGEVPFNENVRFKIGSLTGSDIPQDPHFLFDVISQTLQDSGSYIILSSKVNNDVHSKSAHHAVVVIGAGTFKATGNPYIIVAEPNGATFSGSKTFGAIQKDWFPIKPGGFTTIIALNSRSIGLFNALTFIQAIEEK